VLIAKGEEQKKLDRVLREFIIPFLKDAETLVMSSDGDPFASKHYRSVMKEVRGPYPDLKLALCTNAVLLDERAWEELELEGRVKHVQISIDAATAETYSRVRRGGDFERLLRNLKFLSRLKDEGRIGIIDLLFVVQATNFEEMAKFVQLGQSLSVSTVQFARISLWPRAMDEARFSTSQVWSPAHPWHSTLLDVLRDPIFDDPIVRMNDVRDLRLSTL
jgi:MoaA/NifB/PqqE/SkfB family radical SAM enzyme